MTGAVMHLYEIGNPSDPYTMECTDDVVAVVAVLFLGEGAYFLKPLNRPDSGASLAPFLLIDGETRLQKWCDDHGVADLGEWAIDHAEAVAAALDSVLVGSAADRQTFEKMLACVSSEEERAKARAVYYEGKRTSMNQIGRRAQQLAAKFRSLARTTPARPEEQRP